ncbi:MAG: MBL fold metallo-hydrolase [Acidobacteriota bacterium]|jgi:cyclase|nr:MBL fold metallo-hydrolase [Acidobacteriota bacterium]
MRQPLLRALALSAVVTTLAPAQPRNFDNTQEHLLPVQGNTYMLAGAGGNTTLQVGKDGVLVVDTQYAEMAPKILSEIRKLSDKPIVWMVNTHIDQDHSGGNAALAKLGRGPGPGPRIIAHENVLNRMTQRVPNQPPVPDEALPNDEYGTPQKDLFFNGEAVVIYHMPRAHTDGDSIVFFRRSDVVSVGDIFTPDQWPAIDLARGGSVEGTLDALNYILTLTVPERYQDGGTLVVPGHGRISNEADVVEYRNMLTIVRDRVQDLLKKGMTLEQVKAARPARDYETEYSERGLWTKDMFVEAVYRSLNGNR